MTELKELFVEYEIKLDLDELQRVFDRLDADGTGTLDLQEFKDWQYNPDAKDGFRRLVQKVRENSTDANGISSQTG